MAVSQTKMPPKTANTAKSTISVGLNWSHWPHQETRTATATAKMVKMTIGIREILPHAERPGKTGN